MRSFSIIAVTLLMLTLSACSEPVWMIPGKALTGEAAEVPATWTNVPETIQLETRPAEPYSVNIWAAGIGANLYVATRDSSWTKFINADARVRVQIHEKVYSMQAMRVADEAEIAVVAKRYVEKYSVDADDNFVEQGQLFRLTRRQAAAP